MSSRLTRRALFALLVALPVAVVAAKVVSSHASNLRDGFLSPSAIRRVENLKPLPFKLLKTVDMPWASSGGYDEIRKTLFDSGWLPARPMPTKFTDDELAATLGVDATKSCGGVESRHAAPVGSRKASDRKAWSGEPGGPSGTLNQITEPEVAPGPHDTPAQPVVA